MLLGFYYYAAGSSGCWHVEAQGAKQGAAPMASVVMFILIPTGLGVGLSALITVLSEICRIFAGSRNCWLLFSGNHVNDNDVFHDRDAFVDNYKEMNRSLKIYVYPHQKDDPFSNVLLAVDFEPGGNYASESYFKKVLKMSHFITRDPSNADLFFLPFSIARLRHDPRVGINGIKDFIKSYIFNISHEYPYWNLTNGADHFYVACHSIGRFAMEKVVDVKINVIQVVCTSSYFVSAYIPHKDASLPQIWPRLGGNPDFAPYKREVKLKRESFYKGLLLQGLWIGVRVDVQLGELQD
ncbi:hypothetical protein KY285_001066 [Solanum tuberosum]|nr:hypothetical protein KY285_001066 [Solanum tuberosum]